MAETTTTRFIKATRSRIYHALIDGQALSEWLHPAGTTSKLYVCDPKVGGHLRMSITHGPGTEGTRLFDLIFAELRPDEAVVFKGSFVSDDPAMASVMQLTFTLKDETAAQESHCVTRASRTTYRLKTMSVAPNRPLIIWRAL